MLWQHRLTLIEWYLVPELESSLYKRTLTVRGLHLSLRVLQSCTRMAPLHPLRIALVSALLLTSVSGHCRAPRVRREWRSITSDERASWINAVNVCSPLA